LLLSRALHKNVVVSVGIHEDVLTREGIQRFTDRFYELVEIIRQAYHNVSVE
jgi:hypothetical protein